MSDRKAIREVNKAIKHLMAYVGPNNEWEGRLEQLQYDLLEPLVKRLGVDRYELEDFFVEGPYQGMFFGFAFEEYATALWDGEAHSLVDSYLEHRGWRESPVGRRYLRALADSELGFWEVTAVKVGAYAEVRPFGSGSKPLRVREKAATEGLRQWDGLLARVLTIDGVRQFSGALLPLSQDQASRLQALLEDVPNKLENLFREMVDEGELDAFPEDFEELAGLEQILELAEIAFQLWAMEVYQAHAGPGPQLRSTHNEAIAPASVRFPVQAGQAELSRALDASPVLHRDTDGAEWHWFAQAYDDIDFGEKVAMLGNLSLGAEGLTLTVNSMERAERGKELIADLLGDLVGSPLIVHESLSALENEAGPFAPSEVEPVEVTAAVTAAVTRHYRETLDDAVPTLGGRTPRECAADPALRGRVVTWLKELEYSSSRSPGVDFDFAWMWEELGLDRDLY